MRWYVSVRTGAEGWASSLSSSFWLSLRRRGLGWSNFHLASRGNQSGSGDIGHALEQQPRGFRRPRREISGVCLVQVGADVDALLDDREVLVKREAVDGSVRQLQQLQPVLLSLSHRKKKNTI